MNKVLSAVSKSRARTRTWAVTSAAVAAIMIAGPALATDKKPSDPSQHQGQGQLQGQAQGQIAKGGNAHSSAGAVAGAKSGSLSGAYSGGNSQDTNQENGQSVGGDDNSSDVEAWGFSYVDSAPQVPPAAIGDGTVVTSQNLKVLGPVFGYAWQDMQLTPSGLGALADVLGRASMYDGSKASYGRALDAAAVLCVKEPEVAKVRFGDKCDDLASIFPPVQDGE